MNDFIQILIEVLLQIVTIQVDPNGIYSMKKTLLTTIIAFALACIPADSAMVVVDYIGETFVGSNTIERNLIVNSDDGRNYDIAIRPLQEEITNSDGSVSLPLRFPC